MKNNKRGVPYFTHFMSLPFIHPQYRQNIGKLQDQIQEIFGQYQRKQCLRIHSHMLCHITLFMMTLKRKDIRQKCSEILAMKSKQIIQLIQGLQIQLSQVKYFTRFHKNLKCDQITVIYFEIQNEAKQKLEQLTDILIRQMMKEQVIVHQQLTDMHIFYDHKTGKFKPQTLHMSLFRANNLMVDAKTIQIFEQINKAIKQPLKFSCHLLDISTMKEYNQQQFYLPLSRLKLSNMTEKKEQA